MGESGLDMKIGMIDIGDHSHELELAHGFLADWSAEKMLNSSVVSGHASIGDRLIERDEETFRNRIIGAYVFLSFGFGLWQIGRLASIFIG